MYINPYVNYDYEEVLNPYFISTLTPATKLNPYLSSSAANVLVSPHSPYVLSPTITIEKKVCKDNKTNDNKKIQIKMPLLSPIYQSYNSRYSTYHNVNNDRELIRSVTKYFYEATMTRWLYSDFQDLLKYLVIKNGKIHVVKSQSEMENNKLDNKMDDMKLKIKFISEYVMTKYDMKKFLKKLALRSGLDLWKFRSNKSKVKKVLFKKLKKKLESLAFKF